MNDKNLYLYGISRVDRTGKDGYAAHYWFVRLHFKNGKPLIQKTFHDIPHGGISQSLAVAVGYRDLNVKRELIKRIPGQPQIENIYAEHHKCDKWKKERIERRLKTIEEHGRKTIHVGTGIEAAQKARKMGASKVTCWKIKSGRQDFYKVYNFMPSVDLDWQKRRTKKHSDIEVQQKKGKQRFVLGTGREAAVEAQELGASQTVCLHIQQGKQDFFNCCHTISHFEANGFKRELTQEVIDKIRHITARYINYRPLDVASEVMLNYISRNDIPTDEDTFIKNLVCKYGKILKFDKGRKKEVSLYALHKDSDDEYNITDRIVYNQWLEGQRRW